MACPDSLIGISCRSNFDEYFINYLLLIEQPRMDRLAPAAAQKNINVEFLKPYSLIIPLLKEQQKIASFLTAVDKRIQLLEEKKKHLERYKKGAMQQIFSQEFRFKDEHGKAFPDWEEKKLGEVYSFLTTNSFSRENLNYQTGTVKNIHYGDIHTKFKSHFEIKEELVPYINDNVDLSRINDENYLQEGDLVIADASEDYADIGKMIEIIDLNQEKVLAGLHTVMARRKSNEPIVGFAGHLMKSYNLRLSIMRIAQGTKVLGISATRLRNISVTLPSNKEQQKIASFLSAIDEAIEKVGKQVEETQQFKKGLLQKMFV